MAVFFVNFWLLRGAHDRRRLFQVKSAIWQDCLKDDIPVDVEENLSLSALSQSSKAVAALKVTSTPSKRLRRDIGCVGRAQLQPMSQLN